MPWMTPTKSIVRGYSLAAETRDVKRTRKVASVASVTKKRIVNAPYKVLQSRESSLQHHVRGGDILNI